MEKHHSTLATLKMSKKFTTKRLIRDDGSKHFQIEEELSKIKKDIGRVNRELLICQERYKEIAKELKAKQSSLKKINDEIQRLKQKKERLLAPRGI